MPDTDQAHPITNLTKKRVGAVSSRRNQAGFTMIELLIVCVIIILLIGLVAVTFAGMQQKARDKQRSNDIKTLHVALEAYYAQNVKYPTLNNLNDAAWRAKNLKGIDSEALQDPKSKTAQLTATPAVNHYSYEVVPIGCTNLDNNDCSSYTLSVPLEGGGSFTRTNQN